MRAEYSAMVERVSELEVLAVTELEAVVADMSVQR